MKSFSDRLKQAMSIKKITQSELCERTGIPKSAMSQYVSGAFTPKQERTYLIAKALNVNEPWLLGYDNVSMGKNDVDTKVEKINFNYAENSKIRKIPIFKTVSAGFGAYADDNIVGYEPVLIESDYDAENTLAIVVQGDSMYPKIENGDIIVVLKQECFENGDIIVAIPNDGTDNGYVKRAFCTDNELILESINNSYPPMRYTREEMNQIHIVGIVKKIIKSI